MIEILNEGNFDEKVLQSSGNVLVEFFATWCPHCQRMMPIISDVAERVQGQAVVYQVDVDKSPDLAQTYAPNGFPSFAFCSGSTQPMPSIALCLSCILFSRERTASRLNGDKFP